jgi:hypothetical protein
MPGYGATESLSAIITAFREDDNLRIDNSINTIGIYWIDGKLVPVKIEKYILSQEQL